MGWYVSGNYYVENDTKNVLEMLTKHGCELKASTKSPFPQGYCPELETPPELEQKNTSYYQDIIDFLRWAVELVRFNTTVEVSLLSRFLYQPIIEHLEHVFNIFEYLKLHPNFKKLMNPAPVDLGSKFVSRFQYYSDWYEFYGDAEEELPSYSTTPRGKVVELNIWVDADNSGELQISRSHTGVIVCVNSAPIVCYSKRQAII